MLTEQGPYCDRCDEARTGGMVEALRWAADVCTEKVERPHKSVYECIHAKLRELGGEDG